MEKSRFYIIIVVIFFLIFGTFFYLAVVQTESNNSKIRCVNFRDARDYIGQEKCVYGKIYNIYTTSGGTLFINFCSDFRICPFQSVIFSRYFDRFFEIEKYEGKDVIMKGEITTFEGGAQIILRDPKYLKIKN